LKEFNDSLKLHAWFQMLPLLTDRMHDAITGGRTPSPKDINDAIVAVLHGITQSCPVRNANLAKITIAGPDPWLTLPRLRGAFALAFLFAGEDDLLVVVDRVEHVLAERHRNGRRALEPASPRGHALFQSCPQNEID